MKYNKARQFDILTLCFFFYDNYLSFDDQDFF